MPRRPTEVPNRELLAAALEGLQLQRERIEEQIRKVRELLGVRRGRPPAAAKPVVKAPAAAPAKRRTLSAEARKRISLAQKKRWAEYRKKMAAAG
ncbi:MAG: hypothetical protein ACP5U2_07340 [Bryobacteraceae bacterium]